jgi:hypothetical protein
VLEDAAGKRISIKTTLNHPFHVEGWVSNRSLVVEAEVADLSQFYLDYDANGSPAASTSVTSAIDLKANLIIDPSRLFPSEDKTRFGDWVKAGALKRGDKVSTLGSVPDSVPADNAIGPIASGPVAANDNVRTNAPLTVADILRDNQPSRVYNFEVESLRDQLTHNYFVGDDWQSWVHNGTA